MRVLRHHQASIFSIVHHRVSQQELHFPLVRVSEIGMPSSVQLIVFTQLPHFR